MSDRDRLISTAGRTEVERVRYKEIKMEDVGESVTVRDEIHARANHFIKQSRPYFPNKKLRTYIDGPYFLRAARILFCASFFGAFVALGAPGSEIVPEFCFVTCLLLFFVYCQHEWVNQKSLPVVYKQPVWSSQKKLNAFYEVTVTELDGVALQNYQAGVGFVQASQGKIEFQAFNIEAKKNMMEAKCQSRLMLVLFVGASAYNCYFMAAY